MFMVCYPEFCGIPLLGRKLSWWESWALAKKNCFAMNISLRHSSNGIMLDTLECCEIEMFAKQLATNVSRMYRVALRILGWPEAAQDVSQEACVKALREAAKFNGHSTMSTWGCCRPRNTASGNKSGSMSCRLYNAHK